MRRFLYRFPGNDVAAVPLLVDALNAMATMRGRWARALSAMPPWWRR
jgi:hypothetical protein